MPQTFFMLSAEETSLFTFTGPDQAQIETALDAVNMAGRSYIAAASWYSPTRIDRYDPATRATNTRVQRVLAVNDGVVDPLTKAREIANNMKQVLDHAGDGLSGVNTQTWTGVTTTPFSEANMGPLASWHSGAATVSQTANQYPNPVGLPSTASLAELKWLAVLALAGVGVWLAWPVLAGARRGSQMVLQPGVRRPGSTSWDTTPGARTLRASFPEPVRGNPSGQITRGPVAYAGPVTGTLELTAKETAAYRAGGKQRFLERAQRYAQRHGGDVEVFAADGTLLGIAHSLKPARRS